MQADVKQMVNTFVAECRAKELRVTPQRMEIFTELARATDHPTAEVLYQRLVERMPTLSLDTIYRTLGTFSQLGLVNKVETSESQAHFEVSQVPHHHLICRKCKEIVDFQWPLFDTADLPDAVHMWGHVERKNIVVYGVCRKCLGRA